MKQFMTIVEEAVESLPEEIKRHLENVVIDVEKRRPMISFARPDSLMKRSTRAKQSTAISCR